MVAVAPNVEHELRDAHLTAKLLPYLRELWERRSYIWHVSVNELRSRQITNVLGNIWHLLNPALSIGVYFVIFGLLLKTTRGVDNFLLFLTVGLFVFQFTQKSTVDGSKTIITNGGLIKGVRFPRAILPITSTVTELLSSLSTFVMMFAILLISGQYPRWTWLLFPLLIAVQFLFNLGSAFIAARAATHFRDTTQILPFIFRLLLYGSGVIYNVDAYLTNDAGEVNEGLKLIFTLNPMYCFLTVARWTLLGNNDLGAGVIVSGVVWSVGLLCIGFLWFRRAEESYARD